MEFPTSPISERSTSSIARSRAASPPRVIGHGSPPPPPPSGARSPAQLPPGTQPEYTMQRGLPPQPAGPRSRPSISYNQQRTVSSQQTPRSPPQPRSPVGPTTQPWMSSTSSDGHGRGSMDVPPPFAAMDPSMNLTTSPAEESHNDGRTPPPQATSNMNEARYSVPPPPPLNIPQAPASTPLRPMSSSPQPLSSSPQPLSIPLHRHSDIPSPSGNSLAQPLPARQRLSDVPSPSNRTAPATAMRNPPPPPPPSFYGSNQASFVHQFDKKMSFAPKPEGMSRSAALYASAMAKTSSPSVRIDLNTMAYSGHGQNQPTPGVKDTHHPGSFYSWVVSFLNFAF